MSLGKQDVEHTDTERNGSVLVIDDNPAMVKLVTHRLKKRGYDCLHARDGRSGLEMAHEHRPDVIVTDWMMPGLSGPEVCRRIREDDELKRTYVILLTSKDGRDDRIEGLESGADEFLSKPCDGAELIARVRTGLRVRAMQAEIASAQHARALVRMAVTLGHEINNPLMALLGSMDLLERDSDKDDHEGLRQRVGKCRSQIEQLAETVARLRNLKTDQTSQYVGDLDMYDLAG